MTIPALFVDNLVQERTKRAKDVIGEIGASRGWAADISRAHLVNSV
ncbi:MAG: hypothetical protein ACRD2U_06325 [Terriglobales bacterium]